MKRTVAAIWSLCSCIGIVSCSVPSAPDEMSEILSSLPATTLDCFVARSLDDLSYLSAGYGPILSQEGVDWLLLPAGVERTEEYTKRGLASDRPIVVAHLSGDPGPEQERLLIVLPVQDVAMAREAILEHIRSVASLVDHSDLIIVRSPYDGEDLGAVRFVGGKWLIVGLEESRDGAANPGSVLDEFGADRVVSLNDWLKFPELQKVLPQDWCMLMYRRQDSGMSTLSLNRTSRGEAKQFKYDEEWQKGLSIGGWVQRAHENGWLPALMEAVDSAK